MYYIIYIDQLRHIALKSAINFTFPTINIASTTTPKKWTRSELIKQDGKIIKGNDNPERTM
ncbi:hypothetical protein EV194_10194 [Natronoflexus pectinivorans]|uniref:Uncharacterized protein n=1 Tax=Natronoflexus pectinivorans TaxID=682526 RepID=A0A4R2GMF2_9BACT|nr:hypothetical protein EV194_10194 [Natronoflexus pectinivorans]